MSKAEVWVGSQNVRKNDSTAAILADIRGACAHASVVGLQEAHGRHASRAVRKVRRTKRWAGYRPGGPAKENTILWDTRVWRQRPGRFRVYTHRGRRKVTPRRSVVCLPLEHRKSGHLVLFADTHAINGYSHARNRFERFRDAMAHIHWAAVRACMAAAIHSRRYDAVVLMGDFNCRLENRRESWYPGPMLDGLFRFDHSGSIDRIIVAGAAELTGRRSRKARSDHRLQLGRIRIG